MFYYYGRKKQIAKYYPKPMHNTIVEPFAGSAAYSLHGKHWERRVILIEKDIRVAQVWKWLIEEATPSSILALPILKVGEKSSEFLHIIHAATKQAFKYKTIKVTPVLERNWEISRRIMAQNLYKIKHWEIIHGDYKSAPNIEATWFVDPPYNSSSGTGYEWGSASINYKDLADWTADLPGQVICCEGSGANYLPFRPLLSLAGVAGKVSEEMIFHNRDEPQLFT